MNIREIYMSAALGGSISFAMGAVYGYGFMDQSDIVDLNHPELSPELAEKIKTYTEENEAKDDLYITLFWGITGAMTSAAGSAFQQYRANKKLSL